MAGASDKARFYLEQQVPELKEYEKKEIFSRDEITSIARKRSDFEHKINARGSQASDYARYAEFEINLDSLRRKRVKRLGVKVSAHTGQRRIFFILDRATRKFHGDLGLWMQYIEYARKQRAYKKIGQILTSLLRLHPTKPELWIYGAKYVLDDQADMTEARSYMQRGLRFCKNSRHLWLEYGKLEMIYISKIFARRKILGVTETKGGDDDTTTLNNPDADVIAVPPLTGEDIIPTRVAEDSVDPAALKNLVSTPALSGAIPIAIFDAAMKQFKEEESFGVDFYNMVTEFDDIPCLQRILSHIVEYLLRISPSCHSRICDVKSAVSGVRILSVEFPSALGTALKRLNAHVESSGDPMVCVEAIYWLEPILQQDGLDPALQKVCLATIRRMVRNIAEFKVGGVLKESDIERLLKVLRETDLDKEADLLA